MSCVAPTPATAAAPQTPLQRRYYWAIVQHAARSCLPLGVPVEAQKYLHNEFKGQVLGYEEVAGPDGQVVLQPISTTALSQDEFSQYIEAVLAILVEAGVDLPEHPEELLEVCPRVLVEQLPAPRARRQRRHA